MDMQPSLGSLPQEESTDTNETITIKLTQEEVDIIYFILYNKVGGPLSGPRKHSDSIQQKLASHVKSYRPAKFSYDSHDIYIHSIQEDNSCGKVQQSME